MPNLVSFGAGKGDALTKELLRGTAQMTISPAIENKPRTFFVIQASAGRKDTDALIDSLLLLCRDEAILVQAGGLAGPPFKSHPDGLKRRFDIRDSELDANIINLRIEEEPSRHMIIAWDQNMAHELIGLCEILMGQPFEVPVEIIYVAERTEEYMPLVNRCRQSGLHVIVAEASSLMNRFEQSGRLIIPPVPTNFVSYRQAHEGVGRLSQWMVQAPPGTVATFGVSLKAFGRRLEELQHG